MLVGGPEQTLLVVHSDIKIILSPGAAISGPADIGKILGASRATVYRYLAMDS
ncbi:hypothetical protein [Arthrobacter sp. ISL-95]|uniref:hypothetical protein n=1 Tax=Arthrobacter sp. ISL-95 TaxID=2819116 RepID=UPI002570E37D|nr:hypothetical protein [Arthrobacter sp. ISL-95]